MLSLPVVLLKPKREKSLVRRHPWIFSGAIEQVRGKPDPGSAVVVADQKGNRYGVGSYSPFSQITIRMWSFDADIEINTEFFEQRITRAMVQRTALQHSTDNARRLVFGESDQLPGLVVDRYADYLVAQFLTTGAEFFKKEIVSALRCIFPSCSIYERSDEEVRRKENLPLVKGSLSGAEPPDLLQIDEQDSHFWVDLKNGHKTGFYLDQRKNRNLVKEFARGNEILNCFSYTGGFCIPCLQANALRVTNIDSSEKALDILTKNLHLNHQDPTRVENIPGDVFQILRRFRNINRSFDMIILDPPRFADSRQQVNKAARGYKDINWLALRLIKPGGILVTFSCSGSLAPDLFQKIVADAALDAGRFAQIIHPLTQADDHPVALNFPEAAYLKGFLCRVL